jgi:thiamine pyrophosphate-dependent acetolactate synthase large subunit-like protein
MTTDTDPSRTVEGRATATVRDVTYDLLRAYALTTIFGNLGSTEEPFLADYPSDFRYVLGLQWPITEPDTFYTFACGGLGWNLPASAGIAPAERETGRNRPVVAIIGDGSFH